MNKKEEISFTGFMGLGADLTKIQFWAQQYELSFQFWGHGNNNIYINRDSVELYSSGGFDTIAEVLDHTIKWCEKANPRKKYPFIKEIDLPD